MNKIMTRRRLLMGFLSFPKEPESYQLIKTITSSGSFEAPENGWFEIELQGASGCGGTAKSNGISGDVYYIAGAGGGGGGGTAISRVKMRAGDRITFILGKANNTTSEHPNTTTINWTYAGDSSATIQSSFDEYDGTISVKGATNGSRTHSYFAGKGGAGGTAFGGNYINRSGGNGADGQNRVEYSDERDNAAQGGNGGSAGYGSGNAGGKGASQTLYDYNLNRGVGKDAFIIIRRGNYNLT